MLQTKGQKTQPDYQQQAQKWHNDSVGVLLAKLFYTEMINAEKFIKSNTYCL